MVDSSEHTFHLKLFAEKLVGSGDIGLDALSRLSCTLGVQFLDYPMVALQPTVQRGVEDRAGVMSVQSGKSCKLQASVQELSYLLRQVPLFAVLLDTRIPTSPKQLAVGTFELVPGKQSQTGSSHHPCTFWSYHPERDGHIILYDQQGRTYAALELYVQLQPLHSAQSNMQSNIQKVPAVSVVQRTRGVIREHPPEQDGDVFNSEVLVHLDPEPFKPIRYPLPASDPERALSVQEATLSRSHSSPSIHQSRKLPCMQGQTLLHQALPQGVMGPPWDVSPPTPAGDDICQVQDTLISTNKKEQEHVAAQGFKTSPYARGGRPRIPPSAKRKGANLGLENGQSRGPTGTPTSPYGVKVNKPVRNEPASKVADAVGAMVPSRARQSAGRRQLRDPQRLGSGKPGVVCSLGGRNNWVGRGGPHKVRSPSNILSSQMGMAHSRPVEVPVPQQVDSVVVTSGDQPGSPIGKKACDNEVNEGLERAAAGKAPTHDQGRPPGGLGLTEEMLSRLLQKLDQVLAINGRDGEVRDSSGTQTQLGVSRPGGTCKSQGRVQGLLETRAPGGVEQVMLDRQLDNLDTTQLHSKAQEPSGPLPSKPCHDNTSGAMASQPGLHPACHFPPPLPHLGTCPASGPPPQCPHVAPACAPSWLCCPGGRERDHLSSASVVMWEMMTLMSMRRVLSQAVSAMSQQMDQVVKDALAPQLSNLEGLRLLGEMVPVAKGHQGIHTAQTSGKPQSHPAQVPPPTELSHPGDPSAVLPVHCSDHSGTIGVSSSEGEEASLDRAAAELMARMKRHRQDQGPTAALGTARPQGTKSQPHGAARKTILPEDDRSEAMAVVVVGVPPSASSQMQDRTKARGPANQDSKDKIKPSNSCLAASSAEVSTKLSLTKPCPHHSSDHVEDNACNLPHEPSLHSAYTSEFSTESVLTEEPPGEGGQHGSGLKSPSSQSAIYEDDFDFTHGDSLVGHGAGRGDNSRDRSLGARHNDTDDNEEKDHSTEQSASSGSHLRSVQKHNRGKERTNGGRTLFNTSDTITEEVGSAMSWQQSTQDCPAGTWPARSLAIPATDSLPVEDLPLQAAVRPSTTFPDALSSTSNMDDLLDSADLNTRASRSSMSLPRHTTTTRLLQTTLQQPPGTQHAPTSSSSGGSFSADGYQFTSRQQPQQLSHVSSVASSLSTALPDKGATAVDRHHISTSSPSGEESRVPSSHPSSSGSGADRFRAPVTRVQPRQVPQPRMVDQPEAGHQADSSTMSSTLSSSITSLGHSPAEPSRGHPAAHSGINNYGGAQPQQRDHDGPPRALREAEQGAMSSSFLSSSTSLQSRPRGAPGSQDMKAIQDAAVMSSMKHPRQVEPDRDMTASLLSSLFSTGGSDGDGEGGSLVHKPPAARASPGDPFPHASSTSFMDYSDDGDFEGDITVGPSKKDEPVHSNLPGGWRGGVHSLTLSTSLSSTTSVMSSQGQKLRNLPERQKRAVSGPPLTRNEVSHGTDTGLMLSSDIVSEEEEEEIVMGGGIGAARGPTTKPSAARVPSTKPDPWLGLHRGTHEDTNLSISGSLFGGTGDLEVGGTGTTLGQHTARGGAPAGRGPAMVQQGGPTQRGRTGASNDTDSLEVSDWSMSTDVLEDTTTSLTARVGHTPGRSPLNVRGEGAAGQSSNQSVSLASSDLSELHHEVVVGSRPLPTSRGSIRLCSQHQGQGPQAVYPEAGVTDGKGQGVASTGHGSSVRLSSGAVRVSGHDSDLLSEISRLSSAYGSDFDDDVSIEY